MNHLDDTNKMVETPRMNSVAGHARGIVDAAIFAEGMKLERELNSANERIKRLEEMYEGEIGENEQFLGSNLQGLLTRELNWSKERIKQLESWIESLEVLEQHSGILPEREWFGSEIGYLRKGEAVYKGEAKP